MKTFLYAILAITLSIGTAQAEISTAGLNELQKAELAVAAAKMKSTVSSVDANGVLNTLSKFQGIGKETGLAVAAGLSAVVDVAGKFGDTKVGQITIGLIIWRVAGADIIQIILGFVGLFIGLIIFKRLIFPKRITTEFMEIKVLNGFWTRMIPINWDNKAESEELRAVGVVALLVGFITFIVALANIG